MRSETWLMASSADDTRGTPPENRWEKAQREIEEATARQRESLPKEAHVAEGAFWFGELGLPVAIVAGLVWLCRRLIRGQRS